jgi:hypothetical protein
MTETIAPMPNKPKTPLRSMRIPDEIWFAAQDAAAERGENISDEVRKFLIRYAAKKVKK